MVATIPIAKGTIMTTITNIITIITIITTTIISVSALVLPVEVATTPPTPDELCGGAPTWVVDDCYAQAGGVSK
jgi:hypothetical protein